MFVQMFVVLSIVSSFLLVLLSGWLLVVAVCPVSSAQVCVRRTQAVSAVTGLGGGLPAG